ncbi:pilus assembly protein [Gynuella sp.]|uniref:pilus assembly protein n=1 Tax=Gynuella sp. TaxID=2969146 RepID=UPI003D120AD3
MKATSAFIKLMHRAISPALCGLFIVINFPSAVAEVPSQNPLFLSSPVRPIMMLNMSRDHQLFFKLYDDYSDITDGNSSTDTLDGIPDTTYVNNYSYYGYFDSNKCYEYNSGSSRFEPKSFTTDHYCSSGQWSGNFLNWATMTRIDAVRKILYGGYRITDTATETVLQRSFLPNDAHSFAKYYAGSDINKLTPFSSNNTDFDPKKRGITICNTSDPSNRSKPSQQLIGSNDKPLMRVARGNFSLWASNERWQCRWGTGTNDNNSSVSGINAYSSAPNTNNNGLGLYDYEVKVKVCDGSLIDSTNDEQCSAYTTSTTTHYKPTGLLQTYGENDSIHFGLMTGSYGKNKSGGVLRKKVGSITDEINSDGTFKTPSGGGIVNTINLLNIYGYSFSNGTYFDNNLSGQNDNCSWAKTSFSNGTCSNWGNPQAEIYLESLRYLAGKNNPKYATDDSGRISGLTSVSTWGDPIDTTSDGNYCAPLNILQFNTSTSSYDTDDLGAASTDFSAAIDNYTNRIGSAEGIHGGEYFVGENGTDNNQLCTAKNISSLSSVMGSCPEAPRLEGGYDLSGLAFLARKDGIDQYREKVKTFGVALAPAVPKIEVNVPGTAGKKTVAIVPACRNTSLNPDANCAIVDFKVVSQTTTDSLSSGKVYVNWEDSEQGGDYDQDMWGTLEYSITSSQVTITTDVAAQSTGDRMGFGYIISGTTSDGFHAHSGINNFSYSSECLNCQSGNSATTKGYNIGTSSGEILKPALYYAAKWGGFEDDNMTDSEIASSTPANYFYATEARKLKDSLESAFTQVASTIGSVATAATNSARLTGNSYVYQARFNSDDWSGQLLAYPIDEDGNVDMTSDAAWDTDTTLTNLSSRKIYTYDGTAAARSLRQLNSANWNNNNLPDLKTALTKASDTDATLAFKRFQWLLGTDDPTLRPRDNVLGDIVNSDPAFAGSASQHYNALPAAYGSASYNAYVDHKGGRNPVVFVGANDGMLHAFNASTGTEIFAYVPRAVFPKLATLSDTDYNHQYLVDGPLYVGDAYLNDKWRTVLVGGFGAGAKGFFALDVTDVLDDNTKVPEVIFDVSADDSGLAYKDGLGFVQSRPIIVPTADGNWTAVFANGTNSTSGTARLFTINLEDATDYQSIDTEAKITGADDNGLTGASLLPNGHGVAVYAYGGDIMGNMWKFDLSASSSNSWKVAYKSGSKLEPLIKVIDKDGKPQPITATPTLGLNSLRKNTTGSQDVDSVMVYFGTGKYYSNADVGVDDVQSLYAIVDDGNSIDLSQANRSTLLHKKEITSETSGKRVISGDRDNDDGSTAVDWENEAGWFLDLKPPAANVDPEGERILTKPVLLYDRVIITTFTPSDNQCDYGGVGWLMELVGVGGLYDKDYSVLNEDANTKLDNAILSDLVPVVDKETIYLLASDLGDTDGNGKPSISTFVGSGVSGSKGRISWRQIK